MKRIFLLTILFFTASFLFISCGKSKIKTERIVIIALDGISVEGYNASSHPNIDRISKNGVLSLDTRVVMPSVTLPNWTSHLTASGPEQHGVVNNGWLLDDHPLPPMEKDSKGYYPSIFKILKDQVPDMKTAFFYNWAKLIEPYNQDYMDETGYQGGYEYTELYDKAFRFIVENKDNPTFVFLYSVHTDGAGHSHGWMSDEYIQSIEEADVHIGKLFDKLKDEGLYDNTHFMFLSDHGGTDKGHGGVSTTEMYVPWSISGPGIKNGVMLEEPNNTINTAATISYLFGCKPPLSWIGRVPQSIFE